MMNVNSSEGCRYNEGRSIQSIGSSSKALLKKYIRAVANFAYLVKTRDDMFLLEIQIESFALRRRLS